MTEPVVSDGHQLWVALRYQMQSFLRTYRFLAMVIFVLVIGFAIFGVLAYYTNNGRIHIGNDSAAFLAGSLGFLGVIVYFSAALLGGDAISTDFGARTGYYTLVLPIRRRILLLGRYFAAVLVTFGVALLYYAFAASESLYFTGGLPVPGLLGSIGIALLFAAAAVALAFFFSSLTKSPALSILLTVLMFFLFLPIIGGIVSTEANTAPWFSLTYAAAAITLPIVSAPIGVELGGASIPSLGEGLGIMIGYAAIFLLLSYLIYEFKESTG